jgi:hypothetical protein
VISQKFKYGDLPDKVDLQMIRNKIVHTDYIYRGTLTICILEMENGFKVIGQSACVDPSNYSMALGEQYSYNEAIDKLWTLEGYLLASMRKQYVDKHQPKFPRELAKGSCGLIKTPEDTWREPDIVHSPYYYDTDRNKPLNPVHDSEHI